ncbi:hypothetical protein [Agromyces italicus]|uniref:hypothetical protein n=1 Tax=Agromyces italicus TaxID=279572 RepID=UPI00040859D2|nr:hypothetical protein [Agromyces italicus]
MPRRAGRARELSGDLATHHPALVQGDDGTWYVYSTVNGTVADGSVQIRSSSDGVRWRYEGEVWGDILAIHDYGGDAGGAFELAPRPIEGDGEGWPTVRW